MENELSTYEMECMRAELLGQELPDKEQFESKLAEQLKVQQNELELQEGQVLEEEGEQLNTTHGKLDELHTILSATQKKINNFKKSACGSLSNIFKSIDKVEIETSGVNSERVPPETNNVPSSSTTEHKTIKINLNAAKTESLDIDKKLTSHLDKLDSLINKSTNAELAMAAQTKQLKKMNK